MNHSFKMSENKVGKEGVLSFTGDLVLAEAQQTKQQLLEAIQEVDKLYLDLSRIDSADISFIQLLCSAHRECLVTHKEMYLQGEVSDTMDNFLEKAGYTKHHGCVSDLRATCLWGDIQL